MAIQIGAAFGSHRITAEKSGDNYVEPWISKRASVCIYNEIGNNNAWEHTWKYGIKP